MSNFEQTPQTGTGNFLADVGGMHTMPEQKRFRGRHREYPLRGGQCLNLSTSAAAFILGLSGVLLRLNYLPTREAVIITGAKMRAGGRFAADLWQVEMLISEFELNGNGGMRRHSFAI